MRTSCALLGFAVAVCGYAQSDVHPLVGEWDQDKTVANQPSCFHFKADGTATATTIIDLQDGRGPQAARIEESYLIDTNGIVLRPRKICFCKAVPGSDPTKLAAALKALPSLKGYLTWSGKDRVRLDLTPSSPGSSTACVFELARRRPVGRWMSDTSTAKGTILQFGEDATMSLDDVISNPLGHTGSKNLTSVAVHLKGKYEVDGDAITLDIASMTMEAPGDADQETKEMVTRVNGNPSEFAKGQKPANLMIQWVDANSFTLDMGRRGVEIFKRVAKT